jgi:ankyrin repeat protein
MKHLLLTTIAAVLLVACASEPEYSGSYSLTVVEGTAIRFQLKSDGSFIGSPEGVNDDAVGTWKVEGDLLVCEGTTTKNSDQITVKFDKTTFKLISLAENGEEAPLDRMIPEGENGIYLRKSQQSAPAPEVKPVEPVATAKAPAISIYNAAGFGDIEAIKQHLAAGTDVNAKGVAGWTALLRAAWYGYTEIVELLIAEGADVNAKVEVGDYKGQTPLDLAEEVDEDDSPEDKAVKKEIADLLRKHGGKTSEELKAAEPVAEASKPEPPTAKAPDISIHKAAQVGNIEAVKQAIADGADVNAKGGWREGTPLHTAALWGHKEIAELLIAAGAEVNAKTKRGETPLDLAIRYDETDTADLLRKHGGKTAKELKAEGK